MNAPLRIAFLGVDNPHGAGWRDLMLHFEDEAEIAGFHPGFGGAIASLEERYANLPRYETVAQLIQAGDWDGAIVCLPNDAGPPAIEQLAGAGIPVLCEKPVAGCSSHFSAAARALEDSGLAFQNGYMWRYDKAVGSLRRMLEDQQFGRLISVEMLMTTADVKRRDPAHYLFDRSVSNAGFLNWLACHHLDLLFYVTQQKVRAVTARVGVFGETESEVEDGGAVIMELESGALATFIGGYWIPRWSGENEWRIRGSQRWVHWEPTAGAGGRMQIHGPQPQWYPMEETWTLPVDSTTGYGGYRGAALIADWLKAIREGGACRNTVASTTHTLQLLDAIYESSESGRRIECEIG